MTNNILSSCGEIITEQLIEFTSTTGKSIKDTAKKFKVKPQTVKDAFDIWLSRQDKTPDSVIKQRRENDRIKTDRYKAKIKKLKEGETK